MFAETSALCVLEMFALGNVLRGRALKGGVKLMLLTVVGKDNLFGSCFQRQPIFYLVDTFSRQTSSCFEGVR